MQTKLMFYCPQAYDNQTSDNHIYIDIYIELNSYQSTYNNYGSYFLFHVKTKLKKSYNDVISLIFANL